MAAMPPSLASQLLQVLRRQGEFEAFHTSVGAGLLAK